MFHTGFPLLNGGWYRCACSIILSCIDRLFLSNGICSCVASCVWITSHALLILLVVQNCRGRPRLLCSVPVGARILWRTQLGVVDVPCPFSRHAQEVSVFSLLKFRFAVWFVSQVLLMVRWEFHWLFYTHIHWNCCAARTWCVVLEFFANPLVGNSWNVLSSLPAASVGSKVSKP